MMSVEGIPAFYIHSLVATRNHHEDVEKTGKKRAINRRKLNYEELEQMLRDPNSTESIVLKELSKRIQIRRQKAFHPNATQYTLHPLNNAIFAFWRQSIYREQSIFCINNLSNITQQLHLSDLNLYETRDWYDLISGEPLEDIDGNFTLKPYQCAWITNQL